MGLEISLNEYEDADRYADDFTIGKDYYNKLRVLAGFYLKQIDDVKYATEKLKEYVSQCGESPSLNVWSDMIEAAVKRADKYGLVEIGHIDISSSEMERIDALEGVQLQRLAFTLLCLSKYRDGIIEDNNHWICYEDKDIMNLANMRPSLERQGYLYRTLEQMGYLKFPKKGDSISMQVLFGDEDDGGDKVLSIVKFKNLGYQYLKYRGEPYFECENCGLTVKRKRPEAHRAQKYCDQCAALIRAKQNTDSVMRLRTTSNYSI